MALRDELRALPSEVFADLEDVPVTAQYRRTTSTYVPGGDVTEVATDTPVTGCWLQVVGRETSEGSTEEAVSRFICDGAMLPAGAPHVNDRLVHDGVAYNIVNYTNDTVSAAPVLDLVREG